ncbi:hypothetical protein IAS59_000004 [Cryptococcus gattii]
MLGPYSIDPDIIFHGQPLTLHNRERPGKGTTVMYTMMYETKTSSYNQVSSKGIFNSVSGHQRAPYCQQIYSAFQLIIRFLLAFLLVSREIFSPNFLFEQLFAPSTYLRASCFELSTTTKMPVKS